jgi:hypothetical protein
MPPKEIICTSCDKTTDHETQFCPDCGSEEPWEKEPKYEFNEEDLPLAFPYEVKIQSGRFGMNFANIISEKKTLTVMILRDSLVSSQRWKLV